MAAKAAAIVEVLTTLANQHCLRFRIEVLIVMLAHSGDLSQIAIFPAPVTTNQPSAKLHNDDQA